MKGEHKNIVKDVQFLFADFVWIRLTCYNHTLKSTLYTLGNACISKQILGNLGHYQFFFQFLNCWFIKQLPISTMLSICLSTDLVPFFHLCQSLIKNSTPHILVFTPIISKLLHNTGTQ